MQVDKVTLPEALSTDKAQAYCVQLADAGERLALPPSGYVARAAYALCVYDDGVDGEKLCQQLLDKVVVTGQPLVESAD